MRRGGGREVKRPMMKRGRIEFEDVAVEGADVGDLWGAGDRDPRRLGSGKRGHDAV
jgi:hypothetical protein